MVAAGAAQDTTVTYANTTVWPAWQQTGTSAVSITLPPSATGATWINWNTTAATTTSGAIYTTGAWNTWNATYEETAEQREARELRAAEFRERAAETAREREAAKDRALELLSYCLTPDQLASYREKGWFEVTGNRGRRWRIRGRGQSGNVDLMPEIGDEREASYCAHPPGGLPDADAHLAQKLAIETDEDAFEKVANVHYRRPTRAA